MIKFWVDGIPVQKGSMKAIPLMNKKTHKPILDKRGVPVVVVIHDSDKTKPWQNKVAKVAKEYKPEKLMNCPIVLVMKFYLPKPKTVKRLYPTVKPDLGKLGRAVEDALTGVIYEDDSLVVDTILRKRYGVPGVEIEVREITPETDPDIGAVQGWGGTDGINRAMQDMQE